MTLRTTACVTVLFGLLGGVGAWAQTSSVPAAQGASSQADAQNASSQAATAPAPAAAPASEAAAGSTAKGKKGAYTGPMEIIVLPPVPVPMLDAEGRQRIDPDGNPMFSPQEKQQRDKKGHPRFDEDGRPVMQTATDLGYDEKGKKIKVKKEKPPKMTPVSISRGTFTVDGVIGKAALNYEIPDLKYLYLYVPGMGVTVVSNVPFEGAKEQKDAFNGKSLTVTVAGHALEVASDVPLLGKKRPAAAFVRLDWDFVLPSQYPVVGYGAVLMRPYRWPGSKANATLTGLVAPPPLPANLRPVQQLPPCPVGEMRKGEGLMLPGDVAPEPPCVPITAAAK